MLSRALLGRLALGTYELGPIARGWGNLSSMPRSPFLAPPVVAYLLEAVADEPAALRELREETALVPRASMQIGRDQGRFMTWLVEALGVNKALELGVFTGYSSTCIALGLGPNGKLVACDVSESATNIARRYWVKAGVEHKVELRLSDALQTLATLLDAGHAGSFDFAFIDADKEHLDAYYERCLELLRPGGVIVVDNALWGGRVANPEDQEVGTRAIRALNEKVLCDARVAASLIPVGDGLLLARKRG
jgi:predicted O-methyltransferase YrrM